MTGIAIGEQIIFGAAEESSYGGGGTPTHFTIIDEETLEAEVLKRQSNGLYGGTRNGLPVAREVRTGEQAKGGFKFEVATTGAGIYFKHLLGGTPVITTLASGVYQQVFATGILFGKSLVLQKQLRDAAAANVATFTYNGVKEAKGTFALSKAGVLTLAVDTDGRQEETDTAAAAASYDLTAGVFAFEQAALLVDGSAIAKVTDWELAIGNPLDGDQRFLGNGGFKDEPIDTDLPEVSGSLNAQFADTVVHTKFKNRTPAHLQLTFVGPIISGSYHHALTIDVPAIVFDGSTPKVPGKGPVKYSIPFVGRVNGAGDPMVSITYITTDAAV